MRSVLYRVSWPARRWLADRFIGDHAYSKNVAPLFKIHDVVRNEATGETMRVVSTSSDSTTFYDFLGNRDPQETA